MFTLQHKIIPNLSPFVEMLVLLKDLDLCSCSAKSNGFDSISCYGFRIYFNKVPCYCRIAIAAVFILYCFRFNGFWKEYVNMQIGLYIELWCCL